jgi:bacterioferritin-associated ferredoxin
MYACVCLGVTEADVRRAGRNGARSAEALVRVLGLDQATCCGRCLLHIEEFVDLAHEDLPPSLTRHPLQANTGRRATQFAG